MKAGEPFILQSSNLWRLLEFRTERRWTGWLGAAVAGAICLGAVIVAGKAAKEKPRERRDLKYHLG